MAGHCNVPERRASSENPPRSMSTAKLAATVAASMIGGALIGRALMKPRHPPGDAVGQYGLFRWRVTPDRVQDGYAWTVTGAQGKILGSGTAASIGAAMTQVGQLIDFETTGGVVA